MILFIGDSTKQYYIEDAAMEEGIEIVGTGSNPFHIKEIVKSCFEDDYESIVVNLEMIVDSPETIFDTLEDIRLQTKANIVLMDIGTSEESVIIDYLLRRGYKNFITEFSLGDAKEQARKALKNKGTLSLSVPDIAPSPSEESEEELVEEKSETTSDREAAEPVVLDTVSEKEISEVIKKPRIICFAGTCRRIGTTTSTIQAAKLLQTFNKKVAIIEANRSGYVQQVVDLYGINYTNQALGQVSMQGVELFKYGITHSDLEGYDYFLYDCGSMRDKNFPKPLFLGGDQRVVCFGTKPGEGRDMATQLEKFEPISFISVNTPEHHKNDILERFKKSDRVFFTSFMPDPYEYYEESEPLFAKLLRKEEEHKTFLRDMKRRKANNNDSLISPRRKRKKDRPQSLVR